MNVLLLYPKYPDSFWSFRHALRFISKKAAVPPLGLITVSALLPHSWNKKLVDLNIAKLSTRDLLWADVVFISAMYIQKESVNEIIEICQKHTKKIVAGGPLFTQEYLNYPQIDHLILNEAEITLRPFLADLENGRQPKHIYRTDRGEYADLALSSVPDYHLLSRKSYAHMSIQVSRGCPFGCDFCEITSLLGHKVRMKTTEQIIRELDALHNIKWRGPVSIVDDNFIGNKKRIREDLLPAMSAWMQKHKHPFTFNIQSSIDLADDHDLLSKLVDVGVNGAFIGIETPAEESLQACHKVQNKNRNMLNDVEKIQRAGIQVSGGFIVGFDSDVSSIFQRQIDFIQKSGIVAAMVGLLNAPKNTRLYKRLQKEGRIETQPTGNNTDFSINFQPLMEREQLLKGYRSIVQNIYSVKPYYQRIRQLFIQYNRPSVGKRRMRFRYLIGFVKSVFVIGMFNKGRSEYWKLLLWTLFKRPALLTDAVTFAVYGYHFRKVYRIK